MPRGQNYPHLTIYIITILNVLSTELKITSSAQYEHAKEIIKDEATMIRGFFNMSMNNV